MNTTEHSVVISIAEDFSPAPAGRHKSDGPYSGEQFREDLLRPAYESTKGTITVQLDGTEGYGSSFLEEAFGGLVRAGHSAQEVLERLVIDSSRPAYKARIRRYIEEAKSPAREASMRARLGF